MGSTSASTEVSSPDAGRSGATPPDETLSDETLSDETVSDETLSDETVSAETVSDARLSGDGAPGERVLVGIVTRPHGVRGDVKIDILSDVANRFDPGRELLVVGEGRSARRVRIASSRPQRGGAIVRFEDCRSREQAEDLRDSRLEVPRSEVPAAPPGLYYHFDLVGCRCVDAEQGELGEVTAVLEDGGGDLLEVKRGEKTLLVPFVEAFLESVDVAGRRIRLRLPPGLVETCESRF